MRKLICLAFILTVVTAQGQIKQRSSAKGFTASASAHVLGWTSEYFQFLDEGAPTGFGGGLRVGYGVTEMIEPYIGFDITTVALKDIDAQSYKMTHVDIGARVNFLGTIHPVRPFAEAGFTYLRGVIKEIIAGNNYVDATFYGGKPHLGGGVSYYPSVPVSLFAEGIFTIGKKSNLEIDGVKDSDKPDVTTFRINIGVKVNLSELSKK